MRKEFYKTARDTRFDHGLDLVISTVREVGYGPASIDKDFIVERVDKLCKDWKCGQNLLDAQYVTESQKKGRGKKTHRFPVRLRCLASTEITQSPGCIT